MPLLPDSISGSNRRNGYESKLALPLTTDQGMSALHMRQAVWLRGDQLPGNLLIRTRQILYFFNNNF